MCTLITAWVILYIVLCVYYEGKKNIFLLSDIAMCNNAKGSLADGGTAVEMRPSAFSFY